MDETAEVANDQSGTLNRRRLLQGAAAVGVGAAVWTVPSITSLGGTPAYASVCTSGAISYEVGYTNTSCNCNPDVAGPSKVAGYKPLNGRCGVGPSFPGTAVLKIGSCAGADVPNSGECPTGYGGAAGVCVKPDAAHQNLFCRTEVHVTDGNCGPDLNVYFGAIAPPGAQAFLALPGVPCQGQGNIFLSVFVKCSIEEECL